MLKCLKYKFRNFVEVMHMPKTLRVSLVQSEYRSVFNRRKATYPTKPEARTVPDHSKNGISHRYTFWLKFGVAWVVLLSFKSLFISSKLGTIITTSFWPFYWFYIVFEKIMWQYFGFFFSLYTVISH